MPRNTKARPRNRTGATARNVEITMARFARLPFLIPRGVVEEWTGLTSEDISVLVESGRLKVWRSHPRAKAKFYRQEIEGILTLNAPKPPAMAVVAGKPANGGRH